MSLIAADDSDHSYCEACGNATRFENHYLIARGIGVIPRNGCDSAISQTVEVKKMLHGLMNKLGSQE